MLILAKMMQLTFKMTCNMNICLFTYSACQKTNQRIDFQLLQIAFKLLNYKISFEFLKYH